MSDFWCIYAVLVLLRLDFFSLLFCYLFAIYNINRILSNEEMGDKNIKQKTKQQKSNTDIYTKNETLCRNPSMILVSYFHCASIKYCAITSIPRILNFTKRQLTIRCHICVLWHFDYLLLTFHTVWLVVIRCICDFVKVWSICCCIQTQTS